MRRRQLKWLWQALQGTPGDGTARAMSLLKNWARPSPSPQRLAVGHRGGGEAKSTPDFTYQLRKDKLRKVRRREGRYLLRSNLTEKDPSKLWQFYMQLTQVEAAFKDLKDDLGLRPILHQLEARDRGAHLCRVPGLLPARDFGTASAGPGSGTDPASRAGEVRRHPDARCAFPHHRRTGGGLDSLHPTGTRAATAAEQAQTGVAGATTTQDFLSRSWTPANEFVVPTFDVAALIFNGLRKVTPSNPRSRASTARTWSPTASTRTSARGTFRTSGARSRRRNRRKDIAQPPGDASSFLHSCIVPERASRSRAKGLLG